MLVFAAMAAYIFVNIQVTDPARYAEYIKTAPESIAKYGGRYLARGGRTEKLEGSIDAHRVVILEFESFERARGWWESEEYRAPKALRESAAIASMILVEGVDAASAGRAMRTDNESGRPLLRHTVATVAYRGGKVIRNVPSDFADFRAGESTRTPLRILAHINDLFDWALSLAQGEQRWHDSTPQTWDVEVDRFFETLKRFDDYLASDRPLANPPEGLFQGPVADALTHIGQIAILRRLAGGPVRGENYFKAEIASGRVGAEQATPRREFD